jgi:nucleoid-associated protein YgaU
MPRKAAQSTKKTNKSKGFFDAPRFSESYSSLVLGIVVVIIGTAILLSLVRGKNTTPKPESNLSLQNTGTTIEDNSEVTFTEDERIISSATKRPDDPTPTQEVKEDKKPTATPTVAPTAVPTASKSPTLIPTKKPVAKVTKAPQKEVLKQGTNYIVKEGETLWGIAEKTYKSGYNWVDIARANKLSNPDSLATGMKLVLPKAEQKNATDEPEWTGINSNNNVSQVEKITGSKYTIKNGDTLWDISVRAYGDGYQWPKLHSANKLSNPDIILVGSSINIPRK